MRKNLVSPLISLILCFAIIWVPVAQAQSVSDRISRGSIKDALSGIAVDLGGVESGDNHLTISLSDSEKQSGKITIKFSPAADRISPPKASLTIDCDGRPVSADLTEALFKLNQLFNSQTKTSVEAVGAEAKVIIAPVMANLTNKAAKFPGLVSKIAASSWMLSRTITFNAASAISFMMLVGTISFSAWNIIDIAKDGMPAMKVLELAGQDIFNTWRPAAVYATVAGIQYFIGSTSWFKATPNINVVIKNLIWRIAQAPEKLLPIIIQGIQISKAEIAKLKSRKNSGATQILKCEDLFISTVNAGAGQ